ncbi:MAG: ABC transporter permease [Acidimicrobiales bacterium]
MNRTGERGKGGRSVLAAALGQRLLWLGVVLAVVSMLTFGLGAAAPGDPAELALERSQSDPPTAAQLEAKRSELHLDQPLVTQYRYWLHNLLGGDLGVSTVTGEPVTVLLGARAPRSLYLGVTAVVLSLALAVPLGVMAAYRRGRGVDQFSRALTLVATSTPGYLTAYLLILILAVWLPLLPAIGSDAPTNVVLPAVTLAIGSAATLTRFIRASMLEVLGSEFVRSARARGTGTGRILFAHCLRPASPPVVTALGLSVGGLISGAFVVEWIFVWPGLGTLAVDAIGAKDFPVLQGFVLATATAYVVINFLTDVINLWIDPRTSSTPSPR